MCLRQEVALLATALVFSTIGCGSANPTDTLSTRGPSPEDDSITKSVEFARAKSHFETHEYSRCIKETTELLNSHPDSIDVLGLRALCLLAEKRDDEALVDLNLMAHIAPSNSRVFTNRALVWRRKREFDKAIADYSLAISLDPKAHVAYSGRSAVHHEKGDWLAALRDLNKAIDIAPGFGTNWVCRGTIYYNNKSFNEAISDAIKAMAYAADTEELGQAKELVAKALAARAYVRLQAGDGRGALADCNLALDTKPDLKLTLGILENRAAAHLQLKDVKNAIADYEAAITLSPNNGEYHKKLSSMHYLNGQLALAFKDLDRATTLSPNDGEAFYLRAYMKHERDDFQGAEPDYNRAAELKFVSADFFLHRGKLLYMKEDFDGAVADWRRAVQLNPDLRTQIKEAIDTAQLPSQVHDEQDRNARGRPIYLDLSRQAAVNKTNLTIQTNGYFHIRKPCSKLNPKEYVIATNSGGRIVGKGGWTYSAEPCPRCSAR